MTAARAKALIVWPDGNDRLSSILGRVGHVAILMTFITTSELSCASRPSRPASAAWLSCLVAPRNHNVPGTAYGAIKPTLEIALEGERSPVSLLIELVIL